MTIRGTFLFDGVILGIVNTPGWLSLSVFECLGGGGDFHQCRPAQIRPQRYFSSLQQFFEFVRKLGTS